MPDQIDRSTTDAISAELVRRYQGGDVGAFRALHDLLAPLVLVYLSRALDGADEVEDVCQQVFLKVFQLLPTLEPGSSPVRAWLFTVARTTLIDHVRAGRRSDVTSPEEVDARLLSLAGGRGADGSAWGSSTEVHACIAELPLAQQQVLVLLYRFGLSGAEVAEVLGRTPESVRQLRHRALACLNATLSRDDQPLRAVAVAH